jgi:uncharacterized protein YndB with AHSA1/START domain
VSQKRLEIIAEPGKPTIVTRREVDAPRELVFDVLTDPKHIQRWMGPAALEMVSGESDLRVGGRYRYVYRAPDGQEFAFSGVYKEIDPPAKAVRTYVFELFPDAEAVETMTLEEKNGKTTITTLTVHKNVQNRDGHLADGRMESGMTEGYARLDDLLAELQQPA